MAAKLNDPLLGIAKAFLYFVMAVLAFAGMIVVITIPVALFFGADLGSGVDVSELPTHVFAMVIALLAAVAVLLYLAFRFFQHMLRIVQSVGEGDPFIAANADRLTAMAWIMLALNVLALPVAAVAVYVVKVAGEDPGTVEASFDFGGLLLVLVLFILARVFRQGTEMREDLEGTV